MGRPVGYPKSGGRKPGSLNKTTQDLNLVCEQMEFNPFQALIKLAMEGNEKCLIEACSYLYPKRKALEHSGEITNPYMELSLDELKEIARKRLE